jgi:hypothetical protein
MQNSQQNLWENKSKITENDIFMIKDSNLKRVSDLIKNNQICSNQIPLDEDIVKNNNNLINSFEKSRKMFKKYYNIFEKKKNFDEKLERKYLSFKKYLKNVVRAEFLQKRINYILAKKIKGEENN